MIARDAILAFVLAQRVAELWYAQRNVRMLRARGAIEAGAVQHPFFVTLHAAWLAALFAFFPRGATPVWSLVGVFFALQAARVWIIASLGPYWTTRIMTLPGVPLVRRGPYLRLRHPNYAVVALEIAVLPLAFREPGVAAVFSILNGALLLWRISTEERVLAPRRRL